MQEVKALLRLNGCTGVFDIQYIHVISTKIQSAGPYFMPTIHSDAQPLVEYEKQLP